MMPVALVGDFNVMPAELDVYKPEKYINDALFRKEVRAAYAGLLNWALPMHCRTLHPNEIIYTFWDYLAICLATQCGLRLDHFLLNKHFGKLTAKGWG